MEGLKVPALLHAPKMRKEKHALTLIELILVIVAVITLALITIPNYTKAKDRAMQKEVISALRLIGAAERIYKVEKGHFYPPSGTASGASAINTNLNLKLGETNWSYTIDNGVTTPGVVTALATKGACTYLLSSSDFESNPTKGASCQ